MPGGAAAKLSTNSAWHRKNGLFVPCEDFDWEEQGEADSRSARPVVELEHLGQVFQHGSQTLTRQEAVKALQAAAHVSRTSAYQALQPDGRFRQHLSESDGELSFRA